MPEWWLVALATFAAYRVTRFVTTDKIGEPYFEPLRQRLEDRWILKHAKTNSESLAYEKSDEWNSKLAFLLSCPWCLGFWVSGATTVVVSLVYGLDYPIITWFAMSTAIGLLAGLDSE